MTFKPCSSLLGILFIAGSLAVSHSQTYTFTTIAGYPGVSGAADGTNSDARFKFPAALALDGAGNLYVADMNNNTIRKVSPLGADWVVTTIAGQAGSVGYSDGTNSTARFDHPAGITVDATGIVYTIDKYNNVVQQIVPQGTNWIVTTIAGTPLVRGNVDGVGTNAQFWGPDGIAADAGGTLYVADTGNFNIREVKPSGTNWVVSTIAGIGDFGYYDGPGWEAEFNEPYYIAADTATNLYVTEYGNNDIRGLMFQTNLWMVTTISGFSQNTGSADGPASIAEFNYPNGITVDSQGNIFLTEVYNHTVRKIAPGDTDWMVSTIGGLALQSGTNNGTGSEARFNRPSGIAVDSAGVLYVVDRSNHTIRKGVPNIIQAPALQISRAGGDLLLSWPGSATNYLLETSQVLSAGAFWAPVSNGVNLSGGSFVFTGKVDQAAAFYRLHRQ